MDIELVIYFKDRQAAHETLSEKELRDILTERYSKEYDGIVTDIDFNGIKL